MTHAKRKTWTEGKAGQIGISKPQGYRIFNLVKDASQDVRMRVKIDL